MRISKQKVSTVPLRDSSLTSAADRSNYRSILSSTPHTVTGDYSKRRDTAESHPPEEESVLQDVDYFIRALGDGSLNDIQNAPPSTETCPGLPLGITNKLLSEESNGVCLTDNGDSVEGSTSFDKVLGAASGTGMVALPK